ncbi:MAG: hypothetical protein P1U56_06790 [Saprospiraceae bacterium]|nr:hypothetical protein [Saprospiraceae bacterium]
MKTVKSILIAYLFIHFTFVLMVNLMALSKFSDATERLNSFGYAFVKCIEKPEFINKMEASIGLYVNLTGVNRGYEFFSPNVYRGSVKLIFESDQGQRLDLFQSVESKMKFLTFSLYFNSNLKDKKRRDELLKSVCLRLFSKDEDLDEVHVYADIQLFDEIQYSFKDTYIEDKGKLLLTKIKKSYHETSSI